MKSTDHKLIEYLRDVVEHEICIMDAMNLQQICDAKDENPRGILKHLLESIPRRTNAVLKAKSASNPVQARYN